MALKPAAVETDAGSVHVLVVDDDPDLRDSMVESLQLEGIVAIAAANGAEALQVARDRRPSVILLDLEMPVLSGWQFLERRRSDRALSGVPVLILSALGPEAVARPEEIAGGLEKPLDGRELAEAVRPFLSPAASPDQPPTILLVDDDDDIRLCVSELLEDEGYRVARAANGQEAEEYLRGNPRPACIVMDLWMPVMDGWAFTSRLAETDSASIPIVIITGAELHWGSAMPLAGIVKKPIRPEVFVKVIRKLVPLAEHTETSQSGGG